MFGKYVFLDEKNEEVFLPEECKSDSTELLSQKGNDTSNDMESFNTMSINNAFLQNKTKNSETGSKKPIKTTSKDKKLKNVTNLSQDLHKNRRPNKKVGVHVKKSTETEEKQNTVNVKTTTNSSLQKKKLSYISENLRIFHNC